MVSYGSVARPVNLGPFSRIVEVHWKQLTHIAFKVHVKSSVTVAFDPVSWTDEFYVTPITGTSIYLTAADLVYGTPPVSSFQGWNGHSWQIATPDSIPDPPALTDASSTYGAWEYYGAKSTEDPPDFADVPRAEWDAATGTGTGLIMPGGTAEFKEGAVTIHLNGQEITGTPEFQAVGLPWPGPPGFVVWAADFSLSTTPIAPAGFSLTDIVVMVDGKAFRAHASAVETVMEPEPSTLVASSALWVLCQRSPDDDPTS
ncbi:hypothetical protein [Mesorhizobium sp. M7A.F.Ce.TU.012.03.2.1]|uniref:hypothetical protein n=1 Tax=Mesorhizobium sp. M7A.F.Ce.TU.012.03.2.1 TaxID=2493681 RepID=UPI000FDBF78F|nr:hypothetical protein [Mesorhizobium sp. M7A.F.Ce.TU.012.03.2.1]AZV21484.1 hypothetical protein EJ079_21820 [Mesorhizobium sp. M7A.F.Ce.TU.012.03.2.1]